MSNATPIFVASRDGTRLAVWRSGSGPALVAVHGTTADHTRWARVAPRLEAEFTLYALDRRGRGLSGDTGPYSLQREADDVAAVVEAAGRRVGLLGHSYGALCCVEAALRVPELGCLILYEPPLPIGSGMVPPDTRAELERLIEHGDREGALECFFRDVVGVSEAGLSALRTQPMWQARVAAAHTILREADAEESYSLDLTRLKALAVPTLLLLGGASPDAFRQSIERFHAAIPHSRIQELTGQQHLAMDTAPTDFVEAILAFALVKSRRRSG